MEIRLIQAQVRTNDYYWRQHAIEHEANNLHDAAPNQDLNHCGALTSGK
jgi:hypothetical protein